MTLACLDPAVHTHVVHVVGGGELLAAQRVRPGEVELLQDGQAQLLHTLAHRPTRTWIGKIRFFHKRNWTITSSLKVLSSKIDPAEIRLIRKVVIKERGAAVAHTIAHFTNAQSIHSGSYKWKTMDGNKKKFIPQLAIDTEFFHSAFVNPCMMENQRRSQSGVRLPAHLPIECLMANYCTRWRQSFKGLSLDRGRADFSKRSLRHFL
jgi:hypothetical protein